VISVKAAAYATPKPITISTSDGPSIVRRSSAAKVSRSVTITATATAAVARARAAKRAPAAAVRAAATGLGWVGTGAGSSCVAAARSIAADDSSAVH
jgi:hypothetical protein